MRLVVEYRRCGVHARRGLLLLTPLMLFISLMGFVVAILAITFPAGALTSLHLFHLTVLLLLLPSFSSHGAAVPLKRAYEASTERTLRIWRVLWGLEGLGSVAHIAGLLAAFVGAKREAPAFLVCPSLVSLASITGWMTGCWQLPEAFIMSALLGVLFFLAVALVLLFLTIFPASLWSALPPLASLGM